MGKVLEPSCLMDGYAIQTHGSKLSKHMDGLTIEAIQTYGFAQNERHQASRIEAIQTEGLGKHRSHPNSRIDNPSKLKD